MLKTPVSILQEHSAKNKLNPPKYVVVSSDINKSFTYAVSFAGMIAEGVGRSKQEAKQNAAEKLLQKIPDIECNMSGEYVQLLPSRPHTSVENIDTTKILQKLGLCNKQSIPFVRSRSPQVHIPEKSINTAVGEKQSLPEAYQKIENHIVQAELEVYNKSKNSITSQSQLQTGIEEAMCLLNISTRKTNKTEKIDASNSAPTFELQLQPSLPEPSQLDDDNDSLSYLRNLCLEKGYPLPTFACLESEHDPTEFEAICQVGVIVLSAKGRTKKDAKHLVARGMVNSLQKNKLLENSSNTSTMNGFIQSEEEMLRKKLYAYARSKKHLNCGKMSSDSTSLADRHNYFLTLEERIRNNGKNIIAQPWDNPKEKVQLLLKELGIVWKHSKAGKENNMLFIELDCGLDVVFAGEEKHIYPEILAYFRDML